MRAKIKRQRKNEKSEPNDGKSTKSISDDAGDFPSNWIIDSKFLVQRTTYIYVRIPMAVRFKGTPNKDVN